MSVHRSTYFSVTYLRQTAFSNQQRFENKQPHPLDIFYDDEGLHFEVACTGLTKKDIQLEIDGDLLKIIL